MGAKRIGVPLLLAAGLIGAAASSQTASAAIPTTIVTVHAIPGAAKLAEGSVSLAPAPGGGAEWAAVSPQMIVLSPFVGPQLLPSAQQPAALRSDANADSGRPVSIVKIPLSGKATTVKTSRALSVPASSQGAELLNDGSQDWIWDGSIESISSTGKVVNAGPASGSVGFIVGPDGALYTTDDSGGTYRCAARLPANCKQISNLLTLDPSAQGGPDGITRANGKLWEVMEARPSSALYESTVSGSVTGPYDAGMLAGQSGDSLVGHGSYVYAAGVATAGTDSYDAIYRFSAAHPKTAPVQFAGAAGIPADADITATVADANGNVWFEDTTNDRVGELTAATGEATEYTLPKGYTLPKADNFSTNTIAAGPAKSRTVYVAVTSKSGIPAVVEIKQS